MLVSKRSLMFLLLADFYTPDDYESLLQSLGVPVDSFGGQGFSSMGADEGYDPMAFGSGLLF